MCEFLLGSFAPNESFRLLSIHREPAGTEDLKHIQENQYSSSSKARLLRDSGLVSSYAFQVSFTGKTSNCRTFINQLRSPYSLRSLKVQRQEERESENILKSPEESSDNLEKSLLPIIRDITSVFFLDIEYVYEVKSNLSEHIARQLGAEIKSEKTQEILGNLNNGMRIKHLEKIILGIVLVLFGLSIFVLPSPSNKFTSTHHDNDVFTSNRKSGTDYFIFGKEISIMPGEVISYYNQDGELANEYKIKSILIPSRENIDIYTQNEKITGITRQEFVLEDNWNSFPGFFCDQTGKKYFANQDL